MGADEVRDVQNIADILVDPEGSLERRNHWEKTGHSLLVGVILHVLYAEDDKTLSGCARFLSDPSRTFRTDAGRHAEGEACRDAARLAVGPPHRRAGRARADEQIRE